MLHRLLVHMGGILVLLKVLILHIHYLLSYIPRFVRD